MIQPLKMNSSLNFQGNKTQEKPSLKNNITGFIKDINTVSNITGGVARGAVDGCIAAGAIGIVGRSIKAAEGNIGRTIKNVFKETGKITWNAIKFIPDIIMKAPVDNAKKLVDLPINFYKNLKNTKNLPTAAIATVGALGVFALRVIQGKINANRQNANLDHSINNNH